jgi:hypothetical protein
MYNGLHRRQYSLAGIFARPCFPIMPQGGLRIIFARINDALLGLVYSLSAPGLGKVFFPVILYSSRGTLCVF